jgi:transposase-like protein
VILIPNEDQITDLNSKELALVQANPKMLRFINLYLTGQYKMAEIAALLDVNANTVTRWLKRSDVQEFISDLQELNRNVVSTQINALTLKAVNKLNDLIDSPVDTVAMQAVKDVLDRGGHKPKQEVKIDKTITTIEQKLADLIDRTIDVTYEEVE